MNGWEVIRSLRDRYLEVLAHPERARPRVLVVSGRDEEETRSFVRRLGADAYLTKPFPGQELVTVVQELLATE
jgi:DNA-binding response OmpR family regulator